MPLPEPFGYGYSLSKLAEGILEKATILYVWVTPEESRRKNEARTDPNDPGSILHHGVPIEVMLKDYGCDDVDWLEKNSERPGTVTVEARGKKFHLPLARWVGLERWIPVAARLEVGTENLYVGPVLLAPERKKRSGSKLSGAALLKDLAKRLQ